jgi:hypothetical protein
LPSATWAPSIVAYLSISRDFIIDLPLFVSFNSILVVVDCLTNLYPNLKRHKDNISRMMMYITRINHISRLETKFSFDKQIKTTFAFREIGPPNI